MALAQSIKDTYVWTQIQIQEILFKQMIFLLLFIGRAIQHWNRLPR